MPNSKFIVYVHGIKDSSLMFAPMRRFFEDKGYITLALDLEPNGGEVSLAHSAEQIKKFVDERLPVGQKFDLIGFSMGGIISRYYVQRLGGNKRVNNLVLISAPNHGTFWAYFAAKIRLGEGVKEMRPDSKFLKNLNRTLVEDLKNVRCLSLWTVFDLMIVPSWSSRLRNGGNVTGIRKNAIQNKVTLTLAHPLMVLSKKVWKSMLFFLERS